MSYFEETDLGTPDVGGNGQGTDCLRRCPVASRNRPPAVGVVDASNLCNFNGTDLFQWYGRRASGYWTPFGSVLRVTDDGVQALSAALESAKSYEAPYIQHLLDRLDDVRKAATTSQQRSS